MKLISFFFVLALMCLAGCGSTPINDGDDGVRDVRVERLPPDPAYIDIYTPDDIIIEPGEDKILCYHTTYNGDDTGVRMFHAYQGAFGHHLLLMTTDEPRLPGTVEDCSTGVEFRHLRPVMFPSIELPERGGIWLKKGMHLVLHVHYANSSTRPLLVRDLARLEKIDPADVDRWIAPMALSVFDFTIGLGGGMRDFECTVPRDLDLILVGPHMHELGKHFTLSYLEPGSEPVSLISEQWQAKYRWAPNIQYRYEDPWRLKESSLLRVQCTWNNWTQSVVRFPVEMCAVFGYVQDVDTAPAAAADVDKSVFLCDGGLP